MNQQNFPQKRMNRLCSGALFLALLAAPISTTAQTASLAVPPLINFNGSLTDVQKQPVSGVVGVTFSLYKDSEGGSPVWIETQNVRPDKTGHYKVTLGSSTGQGLPPSLFTSGNARWLGVKVQGREEQPRVLLLSVPYALKSLDAETLGGKPASSFLTASSPNSALAGQATITGSGKKDFIPMWLSSSKLGNSKLFQNASGDIGIGTTSPGSMLDVSGDGNFAGTLNATSAAISGDIGASGNVSAGKSIVATGAVSGIQGVFGNSTTSENAVVGIVNGPGFSATAGVNHDSGHVSYGVSGQSFSSIGAGVLGYGVNFSKLFGSIVGHQPFGVIGDAANASGVIPIGVYGVADAGIGTVGENASTVEPSGLFRNFDTTAGDLALEALGSNGHCTMDTSGDLMCTGSKSAVVQLPDQHWVRLYAVESPDNWFEDFGAGKLSSGTARIALDSTFAQTVNSTLDYHVFLTPRGDCKGLYISRENANSFEVRELNGGNSSVAFDYRIVARRKGYEKIRMEDVTDRQQKIAASAERMAAQKSGGTVKAPVQLKQVAAAQPKH